MPRSPLFAKFNGLDIEGKVYALGDEIDADTNSVVLNILEQQGQIGSDTPVAVGEGLVTNVADKDPADMTRPELEDAAVTALHSEFGQASDDDLRKMIEHARERAEQPPRKTKAAKPPKATKDDDGLDGADRAALDQIVTDENVAGLTGESTDEAVRKAIRDKRAAA